MGQIRKFPGSENGGVVTIFDNQTFRGRALRPEAVQLVRSPAGATAGQDFVAKEFIAIQYI